MRKYFVDTRQRFTAKVETLTQELEQFPALEKNCNIDINDDFTGTSYILGVQINSMFLNQFLQIHY